MLLRDVSLVFAKEARGLIRDRHTVIYSVLLPLFLYPILTWLAIQLAVYIQDVRERTLSRVLVLGVSKESEVCRRLGMESKLSLQCDEGASRTEVVPPPDPGWNVRRAGEAREVLVTRSADAVLVVESSGGPGSTGASAPSGGPADAPATRSTEDLQARSAAGTEIGRPQALGARLYFNGSEDSSAQAHLRLSEVLDQYRREKLLESVRAAGEGERLLDVLMIAERDLSSPQELASRVVSMVLPFLMIIMTALGALYPALEATAGEKERGTLETTLILPVSRPALVAGKYLAVSALSFASFVLNFANMSFTLAHLLQQFQMASFRLGFIALLIILGSAVLLSLLLSALMMVCGFLARSFKEGQAYVTPVYLLAVLPAMVATAPEATLGPALACVPVVNVSLLFREALVGRIPPLATLLTFASSAVFVLLTLLLASFLLRREEIATGGSFSLHDLFSWVRRGTRAWRNHGIP